MFEVLTEAEIKRSMYTVVLHSSCERDGSEDDIHRNWGFQAQRAKTTEDILEIVRDYEILSGKQFIEKYPVVEDNYWRDELFQTLKRLLEASSVFSEDSRKFNLNGSGERLR